MPLTEAAFTALVDAGCPDCAKLSRVKLVVESLVTQKVPLLGGELFGSASWSYKGEDLVRGTFRIACGECKKELFAATDCPRCNAAGGVSRALDRENSFPLPTRCDCGGEQISALAFVPATIHYEAKHPAKARTQTVAEDPGFHAFRVECKRCGKIAERRDPCPLCGGQDVS